MNNPMMDKQWKSDNHLNSGQTMNELWLGMTATSSNKYTTINLYEGEGGDDNNGNSDVVITADSKVGERQRCNELEMIAAE